MRNSVTVACSGTSKTSSCVVFRRSALESTCTDINLEHDMISMRTHASYPAGLFGPLRSSRLSRYRPGLRSPIEPWATHPSSPARNLIAASQRTPASPVSRRDNRSRSPMGLAVRLTSSCMILLYGLSAGRRQDARSGPLNWPLPAGYRGRRCTA